MLELNHKKLEVWKDSMKFVSLVYQITQNFPKVEIYGITSQLRRSVVSIPSNIAEGSSRNSTIERRRFCRIARSSLVELDTQLEISNSLGFIESDQIEKIAVNINMIFAKLTKLIQNTN